jgi:hypothetical protein
MAPQNNIRPFDLTAAINPVASIEYGGKPSGAQRVRARTGPDKFESFSSH